MPLSDKEREYQRNYRAQRRLCPEFREREREWNRSWIREKRRDLAFVTLERDRATPKPPPSKRAKSADDRKRRKKLLRRFGGIAGYERHLALSSIRASLGTVADISEELVEAKIAHLRILRRLRKLRRRA